jgi:hypothetical protein
MDKIFEVDIIIKKFKSLGFVNFKTVSLTYFQHNHICSQNGEKNTCNMVQPLAVELKQGGGLI